MINLSSFDTPAGEALKASPAIAVSGFTLWGLTIPDIIQWLTLGYMLILVTDKVYMIVTRYKAKRKEKYGDSGSE